MGAASRVMHRRKDAATNSAGAVSVRLLLASPDEIRGWSYGEVTKPRTIHYETHRPEPDGLLCEKIFGPSKDFTCYCGKYKHSRYKGVVCDKCGVEIARRLVRRKRMAHIELAAPVVHPWFMRARPAILGNLLDLSQTEVHHIAHFARMIAEPVDEDARSQLLERLDREIDHLDGTLLSAGARITNDKLKRQLEALRRRLRQSAAVVLTEAQRFTLDPDGLLLRVGRGAEALRERLERLDVAEEVRSTAGATHGRALPRRRALRGIHASGVNPAWMILTVLPVLPAGLRPMVRLDDGRFAASDLTELYRSVIIRNNRLKRLLAVGAPEIILRNEKRMLQDAVDALFDNGRRGRRVVGGHKLKSLSDMLKGKQGQFRRNMLGKRVDYSGRSVIVVGPELKLHQCGLPKRMALELFKPFVMHKLISRGLALNIKRAKRMVERAHPEVWDLLDEVIQTRPVLLNRAPTLHRLGIQAFEPVLIEGSAIQLHPLVCSAFNADFDGDQMAVHVPLSSNAVEEARRIMLSTRNLLSPGSGEPIIAPTLDIVLGCYYLTDDIPLAANDKIEHVFGSAQEARYAYDLGIIKLQQHIKVRVPYAKPRTTLIPQAAGILGSGSSDGPQRKAGDDTITYTDEMPVSSTVTDAVPRFEAGSSAAGRGRMEVIETTVGRIIFDEILPAGVGAAVTGGIDFINEKMDRKMLKTVVARCHDVLGNENTAEVVDNIKRIGFEYATQSGITIAVNDLRVPAEKAGLIKAADDSVREINREYDTGLTTEQERYDATVEVWNRTTEEVKKTIQDQLSAYGSLYTMVASGAKGNISQITQMAGMRGLMTDPSGRIIDLPIRSSFREGLTVLEYFISTHGARKGLADTALRTADAGYLTRRLIDVAQDVVIREDDCGTRRGVWLEQPDSGIFEPFSERIIGRYSAIDIDDPETGEILVGFNEEIDERRAARIEQLKKERVYVRSALTCRAKRGICRYCYGRSPATGALVAYGQAVGIIAAQSIGEPGTQLTMRTFHSGGVASGADITSGLPRVEELFEARVPKGQALISEMDGIAEILRDGDSRWIRIKNSELISAEYEIPKGATLLVKSDDLIEQGAILARLPQLAAPTEAVAEEVLKKTAVTSSKKVEEAPEILEGDVVARFGGRVVANGKDRISVVYEEKEEREYAVPAAARLKIDNGDAIQAGQQLTEGSLHPQDILRIMGPESVQRYLVEEVQKVYWAQGVTINDKHIEVIVRQMLRRVKVDYPGNTHLLPKELVDRFEYQEINERILAKGSEPAVARPVLLGITKASLNTSSFLDAASFQETTRVLAEAAISGQTDKLMGLKENVIIGKLIPAGAHVGQPAASCTSRLRSVQPPPTTPPLVALPAEDEDADEPPTNDEDGAELMLPLNEELQAIEQEGSPALDGL